MAEKIVFASNALKSSGKKGIIRPDEQGRYPIVFGAFNAANLGGIHYAFQGAKKCLTQNSTMLRKYRKNQLYGESGHPQPFGLKPSEYAARWSTIVDREAVWQVNEFALEGELTKNFRDEDVVVVTGFVTPWGIGSDMVRESFANPLMNTAASVRTVAKQGIVGGILTRDVVDLITWDQVLENGQGKASKYVMPACEDFGDMLDQAHFDGMEYRREFAEAYEHQVAMRSECVGESIDLATNHLDIIKTAAGWTTAPRLDMPGLDW